MKIPRLTYAKVAAKFHGNQPKNIIAITGTNGKTSIASFTAQIWELLGEKSATIGTLGVLAEGYEHYTGLTTPDAAVLHQSLSDLKDMGVDHVAVEASSHGLHQHRLDGLNLKGAVFCNLSQDHFDYHGNFENYFKAKTYLFKEIMQPGTTAILNYDCEYFDRLYGVCDHAIQNIISVGKGGGNIHLTKRAATLYGQDIKFTVRIGQNQDDFELSLPLIGEFQAINLLMAFAVVIGINPYYDTAKIVGLLTEVRPVKGRMELAGTVPNGASIYVDYAHTPDALRVALIAARDHVEGKLHVVFGCGGDRDTSKRKLMGQMAAEHADVIYVTDDNPRTEEPAAIRDMVMEGCKKASNIGDRKFAIQTAAAGLKKGDLLLVAGKGHEQGQMIGTVNFEFDDVTEVKNAIKILKNEDNKREDNGKKRKKVT